MTTQTPILNDPNWIIFRTVEEKKAAMPKLPTDEYFLAISQVWKVVDLNNGRFEPYLTYRRRKPASQYPRWDNETNPPAFPTDSEHQNGPSSYHYQGMTLRDWFAGMALAESPDAIEIADAPKVARVAYAIADALLKERRKGLQLPPPPKAEPENNEFEEWLIKQPIRLKFKDDELVSAKFIAEWCREAWHAALASKQVKNDL